MPRTDILSRCNCWPLGSGLDAEHEPKAFDRLNQQPVFLRLARAKHPPRFTRKSARPDLGIAIRTHVENEFRLLALGLARKWH